MLQLQLAFDSAYIGTGPAHVQPNTTRLFHRYGYGLDRYGSSCRPGKYTVFASVQVRCDKSTAAGHDSHSLVLIQAELSGDA